MKNKKTLYLVIAVIFILSIVVVVWSFDLFIVIVIWSVSHYLAAITLYPPLSAGIESYNFV